MSSLATKMATKMAKKQMEKEMKTLVKPPAGAEKTSGSRKRGVEQVETRGCCYRCCSYCVIQCRSSLWTITVIWMVVALIIASALLWLGGAFLVGPAENNTSMNQCGTSITIPLLNKDAYIFYLGTSGIIVSVMIFSSCIFCCSIICITTPTFPKIIRGCGVIFFILALVAVSVFLGWVALGTYFVIEIRGADTICRNTIMYLILFYVYIVVVVIALLIALLYKCAHRERGGKRGLTREERAEKLKRTKR